MTPSGQPSYPIPNTFLLPAMARQRYVVDDTDSPLPADVVQALADPGTLVVGGGSNLVFVTPEVDRVVQVTANECRVTEQGDDVLLLVDAGHGLDELVRWTAAQGWFGLERLAEIPGTVGAAPIQNVGAYGVELAELLTHVVVWDRWARRRQTLTPDQCRLSYRHSVFKEQPDRWLVLQVGLRLSRKPPRNWPPLGYPGLREGAERLLAGTGRHDAELRPEELARIVAGVRLCKLPDWRSGRPPGSAGSFFKNPVVPMAQAERLKARYPAMPVYQLDADHAKLSAAWLIDQCGWRGRCLGDDDRVAVSERHALVLIHRGGASGAAVEALARQVRQDVAARFDVQLEAEPRFIGSQG